jgi:hypothetical protein
MTVPFIRRSNGINYIRFVNGIPYVYTGASGNLPIFQYTVCQTGAITSDYAITFIDEAHPLYVIGSGEIGGMWGPDVYYYNEHIDPNFPSCAHILFDVDTPFVARGSYKGQSITEDPFYVYPTGVDTNSPVGCELPMPELNIIQIARPSGGIESDGSSLASGTISQLTFKNDIITGIQNVWGTGFWDRMAASSNKLWIIRETGISLGSGVIQSGINLFKEYLDTENITYTEHFPDCGDTDRYLGWLTDCITYNGDNVSCTGLFIPPNITQNNIQCSGTTDKLVTMSLEGYIESSGDGGSTFAVTIEPIIDATTTCDTAGGWPVPNLDGLYSIGSYTDYDVENGGAMTYNATVALFYRNGIHRLNVELYSYGGPLYQGGGNYIRQVWDCIVPLDRYGVPNGIVEPDDLIFEQINTDAYEYASPNAPRFPNIVFTSYTPTSFATPSGTDCTQFNP